MAAHSFHRLFKVLFLSVISLAALCVAIVIVAELAGGAILRQPISRLLSNILNREVSMQALDLHLLTLNPSARVENLTISNSAPAAAKVNFFTTRQGHISINLPALLTGKLRLPNLELVNPVLSLESKRETGPNWKFSRNKSSGQGVKIPLIEHLSIRNGQLTYHDEARALNLKATLNTVQQPEGHYSFTLLGNGRKDGEPLTLNFSGGNIQGLTTKTPYPFNGKLIIGESTFTARGHLNNPTRIASFQGQITLKGDDLANLYDATGITLPNTPPYSLKANVTSHPSHVELTSLAGKIGDSDVSGTMSFHLNRPKLLLQANLTSNHLDFDDIATFFGAPPTTNGETASPQQRAVANRLQQEQRLFPDAKLQVNRLRAMDARVSYTAQHITLPNVPLQKAELKLQLQNGVLTFNPLSLGFKQGSINGTIELDARKDIPALTLDMRIPQLGLESFFPVSGSSPAPLSGNVVARLRLAGQGLSVREVASNVSGQVTAVIPKGEMRRAFAELMGINVATGLGLLLADNQSTTPIRCAVIDLKANSGILTAPTVVFDTGPVLATGQGRINLGEETMNLRFEGQPKDPQLLRLMVPVTIGGKLRKPEVGAKVAEGAVQAGSAIALGSLLTPLAALLPFVDAGLADDANCAALLKNAKAEGVPVSQTNLSK